MKHSTLRVLLLLWAAPLLCAAQSAYKGQLHVTDERFSLEGQLLHVYMKVSYDDNALNTGETLVFTPVLKTGAHYARLSSVAINGDARERYEQRTDRLRKRRRINIPVVTHNGHSGNRSFVYDTTVPYQPWMDGATLYVECEESTWQGRSPHMYEDLLLSSIAVRGAGLAGQGASAALHAEATGGPAAKVSSVKSLRIVPAWVQFLAPSGETPGATYTGSLQLPYGRRISQRQCRLLADSLAEAVGRATQRYGTRLISIELTGYGAPIGNRQKNERRAADLSLRLKQTLTERHLTGSTDLHLGWVAEDWDSIAQLVSTSAMPLRAATQDIIRSISIDHGREHALQTLGSGTAYSYLQSSIFPRVCRLDYRFVLSQPVANYGIDSPRYGHMPLSITPDNFYQTAKAFEVGSQEFCDIIDLAARLFPDCAEAAIDAAGVALLRGDAAKARRYLSSWDTDRRAWCNLGLLYMLEGNRDKGEVYLHMAASAGVSQARKALAHFQEAW